jgi:hypothetical protein
MRVLLLAALLAGPVMADEYQVTLTGFGADNQQVVVMFDINSMSGSQSITAPTFSFTSLAINNFIANINGTQVLSVPAAVGSWVNPDSANFTGFGIAGLAGGESDIVNGAALITAAGNSSDPLAYLLTHDGLYATFWTVDGVDWTSSGPAAVTDLGPVGVPEPGTMALALLAAGLMVGRVRYRPSPARS